MPYEESRAAAPMPRSVIKRDGKIVGFDSAKIASAITRAGTASGDFAAEEGNAIARQLTDTLVARLGENSIGVEQIQDAVELALLHAGYLRAARAYIVY